MIELALLLQLPSRESGKRKAESERLVWLEKRLDFPCCERYILKLSYSQRHITVFRFFSDG